MPDTASEEDGEISLKNLKNTVSYCRKNIFQCGKSSIFIFPLSRVLEAWHCDHHTYCLVVETAATEIRHICLIRSIPEGTLSKYPLQ